MIVMCFERIQWTREASKEDLQLQLESRLQRQIEEMAFHKELSESLAGWQVTLALYI